MIIVIINIDLFRFEKS